MSTTITPTSSTAMTSSHATTSLINFTCDNVETPTFGQYITHLPLQLVITFSILGMMVAIILAIYIEEMINMYQFMRVYRGIWDRNTKIKWLLAVYPIISITSMVSLLVPRSTSLNDLLAAIYVGASVYVFVIMLITQYGGPKQMMTSLSDSRVHLNVPPVCCCCCCFPTLKLDSTTLQVLHSMVLQFALIRPFIGYILAVVWSNQSSNKQSGSASSKPSSYANFVYTISALMAMWSFAMLFKLSRKPLQHKHIAPKFICLQLVLVINSIQESVISIFVLSGLLTCDSQLPAAAVASRWNNMITIVEMFLISLVARRYYRYRMDKLPDEESDERQNSSSSSSSKDSKDSNDIIKSEMFGVTNECVACREYSEYYRLQKTKPSAEDKEKQILGREEMQL